MVHQQGYTCPLNKVVATHVCLFAKCLISYVIYYGFLVGRRTREMPGQLLMK